MERKRSQPRLLQVLRDLPVCTGVRRGIEDFYLTISGETVKLNRFLDSSGMAAAAGFKLRARIMTALGVQVVGTVLNKNISTGDDLWGLPWAELPPSLQVYGIGDIRLEYICYSVLAGNMIRDLFLFCKILSLEQQGAVSWILEWIVKSLEGVELKPYADEKVSTQEE